MKCPNCRNEARWVPNEIIYGKRYGKSFMVWYCKDCNYYVGCHLNTKKPLGTMVGPETRKLRVEVHAKIDPLWKSGKYTRKELYQRISRAIGKKYHTGESDDKTCKKILSLNL